MPASGAFGSPSFIITLTFHKFTLCSLTVFIIMKISC
uniref:Uncharacterized protein n=1 Tax=Rhizophora mucronata TaxID=61149 RepID=A0A2P2QQV6_RHIMU